MPSSHTMLALLVPLLWGLNFVAAKVAVVAMPPLFLVALRFAIVAAVLLPLAQPPRGREWWRVAAIALVLGGIHYALLFLGLARAQASVTVVAYQLSTPFTAMLAAIVLHDRLGVAGIAGFAMAILGLLALTGGSLRITDPGLILVVASALALAAGNLMVKGLGPLDAWTLNCWTALFAAPQLLLASFLFETDQVRAALTAGPVAWSMLAYTALGGGVAGFGLWYWLISRHALSDLTPFLLLTPVFGVAAGVLALAEPLTPQLVTGGALLLAGLGVTQLGRRRARASISG
jgi:O-acetylserine/cysteine efflux transporter